MASGDVLPVHTSMVFTSLLHHGPEDTASHTAQQRKRVGTPAPDERIAISSTT